MPRQKKLWRCCDYKDKIKNLKNITTEIPTSAIEYFKRKYWTILTDIGGEWYLNTMGNTKLLMEKSTISTKEQEEEDRIKGKLKVVFDHWKYWKFQIYWGNWNMSCHLNAILKRLHLVCLIPIYF